MSGARQAPEVQIEEVSPANPDAEHCLACYFAELRERFDSGFDPGLSSAPTLDEFAPPHGAFLVMRLSGRPVGCGGFKRDAPGIAYIKRMWVAPDTRGLGLGRCLLHALENRARAFGYGVIRLETEKSLGEAQQLYRSAGYKEVPRFNDELYAHHWFEKMLDNHD